MTVIPVVIGALGKMPKGLIKRKQRTSGDHPDDSVTKIG